MNRRNSASLICCLEGRQRWVQIRHVQYSEMQYNAVPAPVSIANLPTLAKSWPNSVPVWGEAWPFLLQKVYVLSFFFLPTPPKSSCQRGSPQEPKL